MNLTGEQLEQLERQKVLNVIKKLKDGKTLTSREDDILEQIGTHDGAIAEGYKCNATELGKYLAMTPQQITEKARKGEIPKVGRGKYILKDAVSAYVKRLREMYETAVGRGQSLTDARAALAISQKEETDFRLSVAKRKWMPVEDAQVILGRLCDIMQQDIEKWDRSPDERREIVERLQETLTDGLADYVQGGD